MQKLYFKGVQKLYLWMVLCCRVFFGPKTIFLDDFWCINDICGEMFGEEMIFVDGSLVINIDV